MIDYAEEYRELHKNNKFLSKTILKYKVQLEEICRTHSVKTVLDFGCGNGSAYLKDSLDKELGVDVTLYDPYVPAFSEFPEYEFDSLFCIDVMEHIPEYQLQETIEKMLKNIRYCAFFTFCNRPSKKTFSDGSNVHCTLKSGQEWSSLIESFNTRKIPIILSETQ